MKKKKILVVDDELEILELTKIRLSDKNYEVFTASDGPDAIDLCKNTRPDLVLLDIALPNLDGYAVASELRKNKDMEKTRIIFVTAKELDPGSISKRIEELDCSGYLMKPFNAEELLDKIKQVLK